METASFDCHFLGGSVSCSGTRPGRMQHKYLFYPMETIRYKNATFSFAERIQAYNIFSAHVLLSLNVSTEHHKR